MQKLLWIVSVSSLMLTGCIRPPDYPGLVTIQTNEIAFLVDMTSDQSATAATTAIQKKDIAIGTYWVKTGRFGHNGYWRPNSKVIVVSQMPARLTWDNSKDKKPIRMTSIESSGFIVPLIINAYVDNAVDAQKYLKSFKPITDPVDWSKLEPRDWGAYAKEEAQPLDVALNTVVYTKITEQLSQLFVKTPVLFAEITSKIYIPAVYNGISAKDLTKKVQDATGLQTIAFADSVMSIKTWAKETYGITVTAMAAGDGVLYDNPEVQRQIDALASGVMKQKTLLQDKINAEKEQEIAVVKATTERRQAEIKAASVASLRAIQEIENERLKAEATSEAIRKGKVVPLGSYPVGLNSLIVTPNYNSLGR
jgi:hypothetical protein